jgi:hypothetical protein
LNLIFLIMVIEMLFNDNIYIYIFELNLHFKNINYILVYIIEINF